MASSFKNNHNFNEFYELWMSKLKDLEPHEAQKLTDFYDKFFTLYVVYNFLYAIVARKNDVAREKEEAKEYKDKKAVKDDIKLCRDFQDKIDEITNLLKTGSSYVVDDEDKNGEIIKKLESLKDIAKTYENKKNENENKKPKRYKDAEAATKGIKNFLGSENICRDFQCEIDEITNLLKTGQFYVVEDDRDENVKLIRKLESVNDINQRASGILEVIYGVRCNLFHGKKLFQPSQEKILSPLNSLLEGIIKKIYAKLLEN
jgi:hypothetical protein